MKEGPGAVKCLRSFLDSFLRGGNLSAHVPDSYKKMHGTVQKPLSQSRCSLFMRTAGGAEQLQIQTKY